MTSLDDRFSALTILEEDLDWDEVVARSGGSRRRPYALAGVVLAVAVASVLLGMQLRGATAAIPGPSHVQRHVPNGTIHWLFAHEPRGLSLAAAHVSLLSTVGSHWQPVKFARVIEPAPGVKMAITLIGKRGRNVCVTVFLPNPEGGGGGCRFGLGLQPFTSMTLSGLATAPGGGSVVAGLASDEVVRMAVFANGKQSRPVALVANAFVVRLGPSDYPANLVAYDARGLVIGTTGQHKPVTLR
jgi:hypothetical protein